MGEQKRRTDAIAVGIVQGCGQCRFFRRLRLGQAIGNCRIKPPVAVFVGIGQDISGKPIPLVNTYWPQLPDTEWCGEWSAKMDIGAMDMSALETADAEGSA